MKRISIVAVLVSTVFAMGTAAQTPAPAPTAPAQQAPPAAAPPAPAPAPAPAPVPFPAGAKLGFVSMQLVVTQSKLGRTGLERIQKLQQENQTKLAALAQAIQEQQQKINTQTGVVNEAALQQLRRELERMQIDAQAAQQRATADAQNLEEELLSDFSEKAMPIIEELGREKELWTIFGVTDPTGGGGGLIVAWGHPGLDLSQEVITRLDVKFPGTPAQ